MGILEEEIRAFVGGKQLQEVSWQLVPVEVVRTVSATLEEAVQSGIRMTKLLRTLEVQLQRLATGVVQISRSLPEGWHQSLDQNTGQYYFWEERDPAGTVTWQRPN